MTGIHKTIKKVVPKEMRSPADRKLGDENISTHESLDRRMNPQMPTAEDEQAIPLPDEEELARIRRRRAAGRGGGRSSTVLSEEERFGP